MQLSFIFAAKHEIIISFVNKDKLHQEMNKMALRTTIELDENIPDFTHLCIMQHILHIQQYHV